MTSAPDYYRAVLEEAGVDDESLTILIVQGATRVEVAAALGMDLDSEPATDAEWDDPDFSAYAIGDISGGVVAMEHTGYADPTLDVLRQLSSGGRSAAVMRGNIQAHYRFGCARDGVVLFDDDEYTFIEDDKSRVPQEIRALFDGVWTDVSADIDVDSDKDIAGTGLAMAEVITGLRLTSDDLQRAADAGYRTAPALLYSLG
jgi:hypothetical protein